MVLVEVRFGSSAHRSSAWPNDTKAFAEGPQTALAVAAIEDCEHDVRKAPFERGFQRLRK
jgi:hypothetical protein